MNDRIISWQQTSTRPMHFICSAKQIEEKAARPSDSDKGEHQLRGASIN